MPRVANTLGVLTLTLLSMMITTQQTEAQGIAVTGVGNAAFEADRVVIRGSLSKEEDDAGDAYSNLQALLSRVDRAGKELAEEMEGFALKPQGVKLDANNPQAAQMGVVMMGGMDAPSTKPKVTASCDLLFVVPAKGIKDSELADAIGRVHSSAKDLGVKFVGDGSNAEMMMAFAFVGQHNSNAAPKPTFYFEVSNATEVEEAAFAAAFANAKKRAETQAKIAGVKLGKVKSIETVIGESASRQAVRKGEHEVSLKVVFEVAG